MFVAWTPPCLCLELSGPPGPGNAELLGEQDRGIAGTLGQPGSSDSSSVSLIALDRLVSKQLRSRLLLFAGLGFISVC